MDNEVGAIFTNSKTGVKRYIRQSEIAEFGIQPEVFQQKLKEQQSLNATGMTPEALQQYKTKDALDLENATKTQQAKDAKRQEDINRYKELIGPGMDLDVAKSFVPSDLFPDIALAAKKEGITFNTSTTTADEKKKQAAKENAEKLIAQLEDLFYGESGAQDDLASGRLGGFVAKGKSMLGMNPRLKVYETTKEAIRPTLVRAGGDVGALSLPEQLAAVAQMPGAFSTPEEALLGFKEARKRFNLPERDLSSITNLPNIQNNPLSKGVDTLDEDIINKYKPKK